MRQHFAKLLSNLLIWSLKLDRERVLTESVAKLYNTIGSKDILHVDEKGQWIFQGKIVDRKIYELLIAEVRTLEKMKLWKILETDIKYQANRMMFTESKSENDLIVGKLWLYTFDCMKTRLESLKQGKGSFN